MQQVITEIARDKLPTEKEYKTSCRNPQQGSVWSFQMSQRYNEVTITRFRRFL